MKEKNDLQSLPNIGKVVGEKLEKIGIKSKKSFLRKDPYKVFDRLRKNDSTLCRCALASIVGAKEGKPWHKVTKKSAKIYEQKHPNHKWGKC